MASRPPEHRPEPAHGARDPARAKFAFIAFHRLLGVVLVLLGILVTQGVVGWPERLGYALIALGFVDVFIVPQVLARKWRTPPE